jgi:Gram-negative bacterial TonB protein C-terminal
MPLARPATFIALALLGLASAQTTPSFAQESGENQSAEWAAQQGPPGSCPVTLPSDASFVPPYPVPAGSAAHFGLGAKGRFGTEKLWTVLPIDGIWRGAVPRKPGGFVYSDKLPWFRVHPAFSLNDGPLTITGKRLDGPAPTFIETYQGGGLPRDDDNAMIMGGIQIPVFGCWRITGRYSEQELSFIVWVAPLAKQETPLGGSTDEVLPKSSPSLAQPRRVHVDGAKEARSLVYRVVPEIPHEAQVADVSGTVILHAVVGRDGRVREVQYLSGPPLLAQAAIDAVAWWQYMVNEENVEVDTTIQVAFPQVNHEPQSLCVP